MAFESFADPAVGIEAGDAAATGDVPGGRLDLSGGVERFRVGAERSGVGAEGSGVEAPVSLAFGLFINVLELLVSILQAYIFTLLTAMYIGGAVEDHHDADYQMGYDDGSPTTHA